MITNTHSTDRENRPASEAEAGELLRTSALPSVEVRTIGDIIEARPGGIIRRDETKGEL